MRAATHDCHDPRQLSIIASFPGRITQPDPANSGIREYGCDGLRHRCFLSSHIRKTQPFLPALPMNNNRSTFTIYLEQANELKFRFDGDECCLRVMDHRSIARRHRVPRTSHRSKAQEQRLPKIRCRRSGVHFHGAGADHQFVEVLTRQCELKRPRKTAADTHMSVAVFSCAATGSRLCLKSQLF
jgi:hypothetical protein